MDIARLECPKCGAPLSEEGSKLTCKYCGHESILESKKAIEIGEKVSNSIASSSESTQVELKRLQLAQELSSLQMQLSNLRSEKRRLALVQLKTTPIRKQLAEITDEEKDLQFRINAIQGSLSMQSGNELRMPAVLARTAFTQGIKEWGCCIC
jgi:uncharacterized Zn finger protein (UPF0148 family)